jgi:UDP-N-acetyl-D-mannosaminuronate dehydrogenase
MSYVVSACERIAEFLHPGMLVILESTTYPGTTVELLQPMFEALGLRAGVDFFLAFSPERVSILTDYRVFDYETLVNTADLLVDTRNATRSHAPHVFRLGAPNRAHAPAREQSAEALA